MRMGVTLEQVFVRRIQNATLRCLNPINRPVLVEESASQVTLSRYSTYKNRRKVVSMPWGVADLTLRLEDRFYKGCRVRHDEVSNALLLC